MTTTATNILLLARYPERVVNLSFLLRLANINTVLINDDSEAFNYLVQRQNSSDPLHLLLIAEAASNQPILQLLNELERRNAMLPIVLQQPNPDVSLAALPCHAHLRPLIRQCHGTLTYNLLRKILTALPDAADRAS